MRKLSDMKKTITLLPLALIGLALSFTSCNNESRSELNGGETTLELSSSIAQNRVTTQSDQKTNHWDGNEKIGVFSTSLTASNVLYTATKAGASTDFTTQDPISIPYGTEQHDIKAYYPYDAAATTAVEFDLTKQNNQPVLYATGTVTNANPKLNLNFGHKLGKLRIKVETTNSLNPTEPVSKVSVNEVLTKGSLNIESGDFTVDNTVKANLDLKKQGEEFYTYLMPGEIIKGKVIAIEHGGKVYKATLVNDKTVEAGKYYRYTISLSNGSAKIEDGSGTIDNEDEGDTGKVIGAPEEDTAPSTPVTATLTSTNSEYASGTLSAPAEGGSYIFTLAGLEAGTQVSAKADPVANWLTFSGDVTLRAAADQTFTVKVEANDTTEKRETTITLTAEGMNDLTFAVQQAAKEVTPEPEQPVVDEGDGTEANPYSIAQAISKQGENGKYVKGYIIGAATSGKGGPKLIESSKTNIMLAESMDETDVAKMIPVELPKGNVREALNLVQHPENKGKLVAVKGDLTAYFSAPGLKNVKVYKFL
ncbi:uncharacterized protein BN460_00013 [Porphyromonas sp. CAG:1061]|nr:uncharacterized protein BN460_00013 [Porphyromonas sp. CAG:1061]